MTIQIGDIELAISFVYNGSIYDTLNYAKKISYDSLSQAI